MMDDLVLHEATRAQLDNLVQAPTHAVLLAGPDGIGKTAIAEALVAMLLQLDKSKLASHPYFMIIRPEGTSISIEAIRQLQKFLQLKSTGENQLRRAVIIEAAHALTTEAQNAFLKLLEEPPADTLIVLTANGPRALLPTIRSRVQTLPIHVPSKVQLEPLFAASAKDEATQRQAYFLSGGLPGLLHALLGEEEHPLLVGVATAKQILGGTPFDRLALVEPLSKQKTAALQVVEALERIAQSGLAAAGDKQDGAKIKQWHRVRKQAFQARRALEQSANAKLTLSNLFLQI